MKIDFFYWNYQCPINNENIMLLNELKTDFKINYYDISVDPQIAIDNNIYFPFLTVFNNTIRWRGPLKKDIIEKIKKGKEVVETPYMIKLGEQKFYGEIVELNDSNIHLLSNGCTMNNCSASCLKKKQFLSSVCDDFYGYLHLNNGKVVGGVEYIPSLQVPYNVAKDEETAFLTCIYHSSTEYDYKSYPLEKLEQRLSKKYKSIIAISGEEGTFPNGNLQWFLNHGYIDNGVISIEENYCKLHLMSKSL
ncbi:hypothetical protein GCM10008905_14220 [Clostridium malenominatum]|uniref:Uncharacterized protein n=1 Tax=Clostridium malenominatum TaxID=1539 RepID=A0ABP3U5F8_9CLOT